MAQAFRVDPHHLSGFATMLYTETDGGDNGHLHFMRSYADAHCRSTDGYKGLMSGLREPVDGYEGALHDRLTNLMAVGYGTANQVQHASWVYAGTDEANSHLLDGGNYENAPDGAAVKYPTSAPEFKEPDAAIDWPAMFDKFGKDLADVDYFVSELLGWPVHRELIVDLTGDWSALARAGQGLTTCGDAAQTISVSIQGGLTTLDGNWDGAAAQACVELVTRLLAAVEEEAPLNRTVGRIYAKVADEVKNVAGELISKLDDVVRQLKKKLPGFWDGVFGSDDEKYRKSAVFLCANQDLFTAARTMVDTFRNFLDRVRKLLEELRKPGEAMKKIVDQYNEVQDAVDQVSGLVDKTEDKIALAQDLTDLADPSEFRNVPTSPFTLPDDPEAVGA